MAHVPLGVFMLVVGVLDAWAGLKLGWWGLPLLWAAASVGLTGAAYTFGQPRWLGKRADGSLSLFVRVVNLPFIVVAHVAAGLRRWSREPPWTEITPTLFLGRRVQKTELPPDIDLVVDLTAEFSEPAEIRTGTRYHALPTLDGCAPNDDALRRLLDEISPRPGRIYVHCAVGHGRSAMFVAALLIHRRTATTVDEAETMLRRLRPSVHLARAQRRAIIGALHLDETR